MVVARLQRDDAGNPTWLEIRVEHLRDYLAARSAGVLVASYVSRRQNREDITDLGWDSDTERVVQGGTWKGFYRPLKELPTLWDAQAEGYYVDAELRRNEWIGPAGSSPRVAGHEDPVHVEYIVDVEGTRRTAKQLSDEYSITSLFFHPRLGGDIVMHPQGGMEWDTHDTGRLGFRPYDYCRFSVNGLGLISVVAVDVARLPRSLQQRFAAHNVTPEGGIAPDAYRMWFEAEWVESEAPETRLAEALARAGAAGVTALGGPLYREHGSRADIIPRCSRFRAVDAEGFRTLAKDVCRVAIDALNADALKQQTGDMEPKTGSLKRLEEILTRHGADGHTMMGPLFAVYDLRQDDAHLPSSDRQSALALLQVDESDPWVRNGERLLEAVSSALTAISDMLAPSPSVDRDNAHSDDGAAR